MEFRPGVVILNSYYELLMFCEDFSLYGSVELSAPLEDANGHVLIQSGVVLRPQHFARLQELDGRYDPRFELKMVAEIHRNMREFVIREISASGSRLSAGFTNHLAEMVPGSLTGLMQAALDRPGLVQLLYYLLVRDREFFRHLANLATLALMIAAIHPGAPRYGRRHAFLAGLCADLALGDSGAWQFPIIGGAAKLQSSGVAARFAGKLLRLPAETVEAIASHPVSIPDNDIEPAVAPARAAETVAELIDGEYYREIARFLAEEAERSERSASTEDSSREDGDPESENISGDNPEHFEENPRANSKEPPEEEAAAEARAHFVLHVLRMARYLDDISRRFRDPEEFTEQAVYMIAYNAGKNVFDKSIANAIVRAFEKYRVKANRVSQIAAIENECLHPPSALAYPRPLDASQIMCQHNVTGCEHYIPNWGIHIVAPMNAFGWLGVLLQPGEYPKCALGAKLKNIR